MLTLSENLACVILIIGLILYVLFLSGPLDNRP